MKLVPLAVAVALAACSSMPAPPSSSVVSSRAFGVRKDGGAATLWTLRARGLEVDVTDHGATLVAVRTPDRTGTVADVVLGFDDVSGYESADNQYFGCTTGRVCNRIRNGKFTLDGRTYELATNNGPNHLHGGAARSLDKVLWRGEVVGDDGAPGVRFTYRSPDGEEGYPGNLDVTVTYWLLPFTPPKLRVIHEATADRRTPVNLTNHAYWNLAGAGAGTVLDHVLQVDAQQYTPTDDTLVPTGELAPVAGTPLDFTRPRALGERIGELDDTPARGYDHNLVLQGSASRRVAELRHPGTGRSLVIATAEPGLQVYSGNFLAGQRGKGGRTYAHRSALCLETQHFPDSVNHAHFPTTILERGRAFRSETVFTFRAE